MTFRIERAIASILSQRGTNFNGLYQHPPTEQDQADALRLLEHFDITMKDVPTGIEK